MLLANLILHPFFILFATALLIGFLKLKQDDQGQGISEIQLIVVKIQKLDQLG
jgi:hypothetical protein